MNSEFFSFFSEKRNLLSDFRYSYTYMLHQFEWKTQSTSKAFSCQSQTVATFLILLETNDLIAANEIMIYFQHIRVTKLYC